MSVSRAGILAAGAVQSGGERSECCVDGRAECTYRCNRSESDQSCDQGVLNEILARLIIVETAQHLQNLQSHRDSSFAN